MDEFLRRQRLSTSPLAVSQARASASAGCQARAARRGCAARTCVVQAASADACVSPAASPARSRYWSWPGHGRCHYEVAGSGPPLLLLPGFGVGSYHYKAQLEGLSGKHTVYALDFLGQAASWPEDATGLAFSVELWAAQVSAFLAEVVGEPAFVAGNSLGGFVATYVAATRPELVRALVLLNATPFWSQAPHPKVEPAAAARWPWSGALPAPWYLRCALAAWWALLRSRCVVQALLRQVYKDDSAVDDAFVDAILAPTRRPQAADVFVSILMSPRAPLSFDQMLARRRCPVCLIYGREDPWVVPRWGRRLKRIVPDAAYYELSPAGHCPHHERPEAVNALIASFLQSQLTGCAQLLPNEGDELRMPLRGDSAAALTVRRVAGERGGKSHGEWGPAYRLRVTIGVAGVWRECGVGVSKRH